MTELQDHAQGQAPSEPQVGVQVGVQVGNTFSLGMLSGRRILAMAAAAPASSNDVVDRALQGALKAAHPDLELPEVDPAETTPARPDHRYSLTRIREFAGPGGAPQDILVMRGELNAMLRLVTLSREDRTVLLKNAEMASMRGSRPLGVASADVLPDGSVGPYTMQGFVAIRPTTARGFAEDAARHPGEWVRVNLWSAMLRWQHWLNVALIFILSCTGYYIMDPFFGPQARAGEPTGYLMGWFRLVHFVAAFLWLGVGLTRAVLAFTSRDRQLRWSSMWPLRKTEDVKNLGRTAGHYLFLKKEAPLYLAHNPLQQLTYTGLYVVGALQMAVGFVLYSLYHQSNPFWHLVSTPSHWIGVPGLRLLHTLIMFGLWAFVIAHVYLAVRADSLERHGGVSSMVNGGVWVRRGSKPVDAPEVG